MYNITNNGRSYKLRVDITLFNGETYYAKYDSFVIDPETDLYSLHVSGYSGNAGMFDSHTRTDGKRER